MFWRREAKEPLTCMDVVESYGAFLEREANDNRSIHTLPYDVELIKASLVQVALEDQSGTVLPKALAGFISLRAYLSNSDVLKPEVLGDRAEKIAEIEQISLEAAFDRLQEKLHKSINEGSDALELEFVERLALKRKFSNA